MQSWALMKLQSLNSLIDKLSRTDNRGLHDMRQHISISLEWSSKYDQYCWTVVPKEYIINHDLKIGSDSVHVWYGFSQLLVSLASNHNYGRSSAKTLGAFWLFLQRRQCLHDCGNASRSVVTSPLPPRSITGRTSFPWFSETGSASLIINEYWSYASAFSEFARVVLRHLRNNRVSSLGC